MKIISITILACLFFGGFVCSAQENAEPIQPLKDAYIKHKQAGWQTYEFYTLTNLPDNENLTFEWSFDGKETFVSEKVRYFFPKGEHIIKLKVEDSYGNIKYDTVRLNVQFWSLKNNWFWWLLYLIVVLLIFYYWIVKILYLLNRRKMSKDVRYFMDILDEHGWVEKLVAAHLKKVKSEKVKIKSNKKNKK
ncbi:hypothetical protein HQ571_00545 [Candidatus Kuenenbacteria bacterium]|nr:hypothetical protein [Candidatus Kuenenbacteria bacterium]